MRQGRFSEAKSIVDDELEFGRYHPDLSERIVMALAEREFLDISYKIVSPPVPPIKRDYVVQSPTPFGQGKAEESAEEPKVDPLKEYPLMLPFAVGLFAGIVLFFFLMKVGAIC